MQESLVVNEIYLSLQGESTWAGLPCVFVRLTACNLRCSYCDTAYAFTQGRKMERAEILARVGELAAPYDAARRGEVRLPLVELTGGEPLLQAACLPLMAGLCDAGFVVLLETNGALDISLVDSRVHRIMDLKCPSSGEVEQNRWENLRYLTPGPCTSSRNTRCRANVRCSSPGPHHSPVTSNHPCSNPHRAPIRLSRVNSWPNTLFATRCRSGSKCSSTK